MPQDTSTEDIEKVLADAKEVEDRKQHLIAYLLKQREAALKEFDEKLAKLGYQAPDGKQKRSHHRKPSPAAQAAKPKT